MFSFQGAGLRPFAATHCLHFRANFPIFVYLLYAAFRRNGHSRFTGCPESRRAAVNVIHSPCPHSAATASPILLFRICKNGSDAVISTISTGKTKPTGRWRRSRSGQSSPWSNRMEVVCCDFRKYHPEDKFDLIVSNPPYFVDALRCPDNQRCMARHTSELNYELLFGHSAHLLSEQGVISIIIPVD